MPWSFSSFRSYSPESRMREIRQSGLELSITQNPKRSEIVASDRPGSGRCEEVQTDLHMG